MAANVILILCAQALLVQSAFSTCTSRAAVDASGIGSPFGFGGLNTGFAGLAYDGLAAPAWAYDGLAYPGSGCGRGLAYDGFYSPAMEFTATSGGALPVTSSSAMAPVGISVMSENMYEGALNVAGELPFVGTTGFDGVLATAGSGAINHACGNGLNAMFALSDTSTPASVATAGPAFGNGLTNDGLHGTGLAYDGLYGTGLAYDGLYGTGLNYDGLYGNGLNYDGLYGNGLAGAAFGANSVAYDRMISPGFAAPVTAYEALPYADAAWAGRGIASDGLTYGTPYDAFEITPTSGGDLPVTSASAIPPTGIAVASENAYQGALTVGGELPFVGTVAMEGVVPSAGAGAVNHACGNGRNAMISETSAFGPAGAYAPMGAYGSAATFAPNAFAPGFGTANLGYRNAGRGCGCTL